MIPKKKQIYNFFDDGKCSPSRLYKAYVKKVIPFNKADIHLKVHLVNSALDYDWIWNGDTDYFIGCYIPKYDNHLVWFARTVNRGWFSMDFQSNWNGGLLDVNREVQFNFLILIYKGLHFKTLRSIYIRTTIVGFDSQVLLKFIIVLYLIIMKVLVLVILSLLISCDPPVTSIPENDSILNYKGATIVTKDVDFNGHYIFRIRIYDRHTKQYAIKRIKVYDGYGYRVGETIK